MYPRQVHQNVQLLGAEGQERNFKVRTAVGCKEVVQGNRREENMVGNAFGGKERQPCRQGTTAELCTGGGTISADFLSPHTSISN